MQRLFVKSDASDPPVLSKEVYQCDAIRKISRLKYTPFVSNLGYKSSACQRNNKFTFTLFGLIKRSENGRQGIFSSV